jgi:hypothetical protein
MLIFVTEWLARVRPDRPESAPLPPHPRGVHGKVCCDTTVAVPPTAPIPFIAGQGARLYSLAAFRRP